MGEVVMLGAVFAMCATANGNADMMRVWGIMTHG